MAPDFRYSDINFGEPKPLSNEPGTIYGLVIVFLLMAWVCVSLRLYVRFKVVRAPGWDDFCVIFYMLSTTVGSIAILLSVKYGLGQHFLKLTQDQWVGYLKTFYVMNACYTLSTALIKEALLLQYLRVYDRGFFMHRTILFLIVFVALWGFAYCFLAWVPCLPVWEFWIADPGATCYGYGSPNPIPFVATFESHTAINMVLDTLVLLIPLPLFWKEGTSSATRMRLVGLLSMGTIVIVIAIWRLQTIIEHQTATWPTRDPTWYGPITILLAILEVDAAAVCASVPIFWPVLTVQWGKIFVTQEIDITSEERYRDQRRGDDEEDVLTHGGSGGGSAPSTHSRTLSDLDIISADIADPGSDGGLSRSKHDYYHDSYVLSHVDPLRSSGERVTASARSESVRRDNRKWMKI
ncbi:hypothetical protein F4780DRAFT_752644 [Xylariomycetidae sp. FL0641]|nr:hypothetical protein F4780DRAFT_752644 [Xylariomycetidae sp. FL0641]